MSDRGVHLGRMQRSNSDGHSASTRQDTVSSAVRSRPTLTRRMHSVPNYTDTEMENALNAFFHEEATTLKTNTRVIVENFFSKFDWYFPSRKMKNAPSLSKAYAYFEHIVLPRKVCGGETAKHIMKRADPGEHEIQTELYSFFTTPASSFIEWGLGVDQYFITVRIFSFVLLIAGLINLPNLIFYQSAEYSPTSKSKLGFSLQGSAVCTTTEWIVCSDCADYRWSRQGLDPKLGFWIDPSSGTNTTLVQRYNCSGAKFTQGLFSFGCFIFLAGSLIIIDLYLSAREVRFDEDKITSSDYTVVVQNPPKDAFDADEWRDFFSQFTSKQVTAVTIALNNQKLLKKLILRRRHRDNLRVVLPKGTDMDDDDALQMAVAELVREREQERMGCLRCILEITLILPILRAVLGWFLPPATLLERSLKLTDEIKELQTEKYDVVKVYVTFEDEEGQRAALSACSVTRLDIINNLTSNVAPTTIFHGQVLSVSETAEANAIRWLDLYASPVQMNVMRIINLAITIVVVTISGLVVGVVRRQIGAAFAGPLITILNTLIPIVVKILMIFEPHHTEGSFQSSLYMKITLFRWVNTALLIKLITSWTATLGGSNSNLLPSVNAVLWSELWLTPSLRILDIYSSLQKHYMGPRSRTQEQMNMWFQGTSYSLGERYTDLTKILFLCFFYSALYPATFFFGAAILIVQYYADKFCLLRVWATNAAVGSEVARISRKYFFTGALLGYCVISAYAYAGFPYDNLCFNEESSAPVAGTYNNVVGWNNETIPSVTVSRDKVFNFCRQSWRGFDGFAFPPTPRVQRPGMHWMTTSQERLTNLFGWASVASVVVYFFLFLFSGTYAFILSWFRGVYSPKGQEQHIDFSSDNDILGYVPQIKINGFLFPFLACDIDVIDKSLIGWSDRGRPYDHHNLIFDVPWQGMPREKERFHNSELLVPKNDGITIKESLPVSSYQGRRPIFSTIKHYPPPWAIKLKQQEVDVLEGRFSVDTF